jgi:hypothetical protein
MRLALLVVLCSLCLVVAACKKSPRPTLPRIPDSTLAPGGGTFESDQAVLFHTVYRYAGQPQQALNFYAAEMEKRGARRGGNVYEDDNVVRTGNIGMDAHATVKDPTAPGVAMIVVDMPDGSATIIDVWENVPKTQ